MQKTPDKIVKLVEDYESLTSGRVPDSFDEAQLKATFIEPIFEELGWDIRNPSEVVREKRVHIRESTKSADYCFNISGKPQFILEAKDFRKKLNNKDYIFQTKLYGYNLPSPLGILTNFGRFKLYDTGLEPDYDNPARGLVKKYDLTYTDYLEKWDLFYEMFSMSAVEGGSLVELIPKSRRVRNKEALDIKFFERLTGWRKKFAEKIALRNPHLRDEYLINEAVQRILDRMVFIRVIEDRGIESVQLLRDALNRWSAENEKPLYQYVVDKFRYLDPHYNGQLFEKHPLSENLIIDDDLVRQFIESLYYPKSPYQFNKIGVEMLGTIYERFLGSTIRLTPSHRAKVEKKPEVRKARGVYYTPKYIVDYIVENTVGELLKKCKTPRAVANLKILDPACGSGSFLLGAFQRLIDWHEDYYNENPDKIPKGVGPALAGCWYDKEVERWKLTAKEKGKILVNNIHGVDIDPSAVEVTIMSLYLKVLEDTDTEFLIKTALLPPLHRNVKCGNSLIGSDYWDFIRDKQGELFERTLSEERRVNTFDWEDEFEEIMNGGGFDAVIGNPPYVNVENINDVERKFLMGYYKTAIKRFDIYVAFIDKALSLLKSKGYFSYIVPYSLLFQNYAEKLRKLIIDKFNLISILDLYDYKIFQDAVVKNCVIVIKRSLSDDNVNVIKPLNEEELISKNYTNVRRLNLELFRNAPKNMFRIDAQESDYKLVRKIDELSIKLGKIMYVNWGLRTGNIKKYVLKEKLDDYCKKMIDAREIDRYFVRHVDKYVWYKKDELYNPMFPELFENPKIFIRDISGKSSIRAAYDEEKLYAEHTVSIAISKHLIKDVKRRGLEIDEIDSEMSYKYNQKYVLGLLNSKLVTRYFYILLSGGLHIYPDDVKKLPIRTIDFTNTKDVKMHDEMVELVERMLSLHERLAGVKSDADRTRLERAIKKTDKKIDGLVYELYGLTEEEIKIVEEGGS